MTSIPNTRRTGPKPPADLRPQFGLIRQATRAFNVASVEQDNYEADDLIATYARQAVEAGATCRIVSSDKDLMQLVAPGRRALRHDEGPGDRRGGGPREIRREARQGDRRAGAGRRLASTMCRAFPASASRPGRSSSPNMAISKRCWRGRPKSSSRSAARTSSNLPSRRGCQSGW